MRHPKRHLADFVDGELPSNRRRAIENHLTRCSSCRDTVQAYRGVRNRLQSSEIPRPDADLFDKIMATARQPAVGAGHPPEVVGSRDAPWARRVSSFASRRRAPLVVAGGLAVVTLATLTGAYALGIESEETVLADSGQNGAIMAGWQSVAPDTPSLLDHDELEELRADGWYCPDLEMMGFTVASAEAMTVAGRPALMMVLNDGTDSVVIYEQRKLGTGREPVASPPINAVTGNSVVVDGFEQIGGMQRQIWVHPGHSWQVILDSQSVTYTVISSLPAAQMPQAVSQLVLAEHSRLAPTEPTARDPLSRILRGLNKLAQPASAQ
ncbi:zf-HC2 domain-containing protein [Arthrobacter sp. H20]|uniref:anti-sigma factor family protein n=1 Tax=Arthrobacter sp. H20 TaxID=1267981 RepID=UPI00047C2F9C|nr:zf-HC2 domain-containing protein [Arthrobacter sp. H20]